MLAGGVYRVKPVYRGLKLKGFLALIFACEVAAGGEIEVFCFPD